MDCQTLRQPGDLPLSRRPRRRPALSREAAALGDADPRGDRRRHHGGGGPHPLRGAHAAGGAALRRWVEGQWAKIARGSTRSRRGGWRISPGRSTPARSRSAARSATSTSALPPATGGPGGRGWRPGRSASPSGRRCRRRGRSAERWPTARAFSPGTTPSPSPAPGSRRPSGRAERCRTPWRSPPSTAAACPTCGWCCSRRSRPTPSSSTPTTRA